MEKPIPVNKTAKKNSSKSVKTNRNDKNVYDFDGWKRKSDYSDEVENAKKLWSKIEKTNTEKTSFDSKSKTDRRKSYDAEKPNVEKSSNAEKPNAGDSKSNSKMNGHPNKLR